MPPVRLIRTSLVAALATGAGLLAVAPAASATDVTITSFDGTQIVAHYFPATGASAAHPHATVLKGPGWSQPGDSDPAGKDDPTGGSVGLATLLKAGYNVLTWDPRGFGKSGGTVEVDSKDFEGRDVQVLLNWLAKQPGVKLDKKKDPRVGMVGGSYGGAIQLIAAGIDKRVDAIAPSISWNALTTSLYKEQTVKFGWAGLLTTLGTALGRLDSHVHSAFVEGAATGTLSADNVKWFRQRNIGGLVSKIRIPTLFIQGTVDDLFTLDEAKSNYAILRRHHVPTKLMWFCGGHGICLTSAGDTSRIATNTMHWLARYLGKKTKVSTGSRFTWLDQDGRARGAKDYPLASGPSITASGSGTLLLTSIGGSGPPVPDTPPTDAIPAVALPVTPAKAQNAVNVTIPTGAAGQVIAAAPRLTLTYSGLSTSSSHVYAQIVDDATGKVLGNQITPIPVKLDGAAHSVSRPLEIISATTHAASSFTLQIVASSTAYGPARAPGALTISKAKISIPTANLKKAPPGY
jgi:ABC-2 type transport system ATP-binding protein